MPENEVLQTNAEFRFEMIDTQILMSATFLHEFKYIIPFHLLLLNRIIPWLACIWKYFQSYDVFFIFSLYEYIVALMQ